MPTRVFLTVDTELMWRHHAAGLPIADIAERSLEPAGVGVGYQLKLLAEHDLKATFFVDPMPAVAYGIEPIRRVVGAIREAGQEVQLHLHPNWAGASNADRSAAASFELIDFTFAEQRELIRAAADLLVAAGAARPVAFRSGSYSASDDTLAALAELGIRYDSSHNGSEHPCPSAIGLPARQIAPIEHQGVIEVPVTQLPSFSTVSSTGCEEARVTNLALARACRPRRLPIRTVRLTLLKRRPPPGLRTRR